MALLPSCVGLVEGRARTGVGSAEAPSDGQGQGCNLEGEGWAAVGHWVRWEGVRGGSETHQALEDTCVLGYPSYL